MKERPILFSAPMVRALLDGSKTQTRRIVKPSVKGCTVGAYYFPDHVEPVNVQEDGDPWQDIACPYGQPSDLLWVRETFVCDDYRYPDGPVDSLKKSLYYRADNEHPFEAPEGKFWKPSIHMPRWASRILFEIVSVRVERLQDISREDAQAEGLLVESSREGASYHFDARISYQHWLTCPIDAYQRLWESINGAGSWNANPWVWVIEFKRRSA